MSRDGALDGREEASDEIEKGRLAGTAVQPYQRMRR